MTDYTYDHDRDTCPETFDGYRCVFGRGHAVDYHHSQAGENWRTEVVVPSERSPEVTDAMVAAALVAYYEWSGGNPLADAAYNVQHHTQIAGRMRAALAAAASTGEVGTSSDEDEPMSITRCDLLPLPGHSQQHESCRYYKRDAACRCGLPLYDGHIEALEAAAASAVHTAGEGR